MATPFGPETLKATLGILRNCSLDYGLALASRIGPELTTKLPSEWISGLSPDDQTICFRATLISWAVARLVPKVMQLKVVLADQKKKHILVSAGTGSGKTLPMALNMLLDDPARQSITMTLSPLKRLQLSQLETFNGLFDTCTVVLNEDTPRDLAWFAKYLWDQARRARGKAVHAIVTTEQLQKSKAGHMSMIGQLIRNPFFYRYIARINVDEAHCIHIDGLPHYGMDAFRPAWGRLDEIKALLPRSTRWSLFSATFPPHILDTVQKKLLPSDYEHIHITSN
ncbi:hypothetical protein DFP72DRAFT_1079195 [Ephemerocybe angulata]|uniref:Helicase ATP-binding domain-containing protein n=1 Tax=Ephemerocybe angulata TaxID=980116 RepID=A0A8H6HD08_9AGAR|nr:hypothetical protein DFP72DRAFT_1079195 [Tulosesus angulatus]